MATNYATKWVEARTLKTNIAIVITKFLYECILTRLHINRGEEFKRKVIQMT
jgi:hypothetical protein